MRHIEDNFPGKWTWGTNVFINRMEMSDGKRHLRSYFWICLHFTSWLNISIGIIDWHFYLNKPNSHSWSRHPSSLSFPHSRKSNFTILNLSCHLCFISLKPQPKASANPTGSASFLHPACFPTAPLQEESWSLPAATRMLLTGGHPASSQVLCFHPTSLLEGSHLPSTPWSYPPLLGGR